MSPGLGGLVTAGMVASFVAAAAMLPDAVFAQSEPGRDGRQAPTGDTVVFDVPAGPLDVALDHFARAARVNLTYDSALVADRRTAGLSGAYRPAEGIRRLLDGSGLEAVVQPGGDFALRWQAAGDGNAASGRPVSQTLPTVTVVAQAVRPGSPPPTYAGGQLARGARMGLLGDKDFLETPFSATAYTEDRVRQRQTNNVIDVITDTDPAVHGPGRGYSLYNDGVSIRGLSAAGQDFGLNGLYGIAAFSDPKSAAIAERVEVLKGPTALLNGILPLGGVGGAINLVTKRAGDEPLARVTAGFGSDAVWTTQADLGRRFGEDRRWGVRINGLHSQGDTPVQHQDVRNSTLGLGLDYRGQRLRLSTDLIGLRSRVRGVDTGIALAPTLTAVPRPPRTGTLIGGQPWTFRDTSDAILIARAEFDVSGPVTVFATAGIRESDYRFVSTHWTLNTAAGDLSSPRWRYSPQENKAKAVDAGVRTRFRTGPVDHQLTINANYFEQTYLYSASGHSIWAPLLIESNLYDPVFVTSPGTPSIPALHRTLENRYQGFGIANTFGLLDDRLQLTLGLRRQSVNQYAYNIETGAERQTYGAWATSPAVALLYRANDRVSVYGNYIQGLSAGSTAPDLAANAGEVFAPYETKQVEAGIKIDWGRLAATFGLFDIRKPNAYTDPVTRIYSVAGEQRNRGIELSTFGELSRGLRLVGGVSWIDAEMTRTEGGVNQGKRAVAVPDWIAKLGIEYDAAPLPGLTLSANAIHTGKQYVNAQNTLSVSSWRRYDIGARYAFSHGGRPVTLRANVYNLFDKAYWLSGNLWNGIGDPRTLMLSMSVDL